MKKRPKQYYVGYTTKGTIVASNKAKCQELLDEAIEEGIIQVQEMWIHYERKQGIALYKWFDNAYYMVAYREYIDEEYDTTWGYYLNCTRLTITEYGRGFFAPWRLTI